MPVSMGLERFSYLLLLFQSLTLIRRPTLFCLHLPYICEYLSIFLLLLRTESVPISAYSCEVDISPHSSNRYLKEILAEILMLQYNMKIHNMLIYIEEMSTHFSYPPYHVCVKLSPSLKMEQMSHLPTLR